ncbi:MAG: alkaline phosphatase [Prolixibacteraceae bacterium]
MRQLTSSAFGLLLFACLLSLNCLNGFSQEQYKENRNPTSVEEFKGGTFYPVQKFEQVKTGKHPKNIILFIGDGMGLAHIYASMTANGGSLFLQNFIHCGFSKTYSTSDYITDSGAGGTALACGVKTYNGAIGVGADKKSVPNIREMAAKKGLKTGLVSTSAINHATPASFLAHQVSRNNYDEIAAEFINSDIDVFIGGGVKFFENRKDGRNLSKELKDKGYQVLYKMEDILKVKTGKLAGLTAEEHNSPMPERGEMLVPATQTAINLLSQNKKGFFLMVEGSEIDFLAHNNNAPGVVGETLDLDKAIGAALAFAAKDGHTLIVVTADHETGGMTINEGNNKTGAFTAKFSSPEHTGVCVPIFAYGPGAEQFGGFMENTEVANKMMKLLGVK